MASQFYLYHLLQWNAARVGQPNYFDPHGLLSGGPLSVVRNAVNERLLAASRIGAIFMGKDADNVGITSSSSPSFGNHHLSNIALALNNDPIVSGMSSTLQQHPESVVDSILQGGKSNQLCAAEILNKFDPVVSFSHKKKHLSGDDLSGSSVVVADATTIVPATNDDQPLDLSSKRALQAATQQAVSTAFKLRGEGKRPRVSIPLTTSRLKSCQDSVDNVIDGTTNGHGLTLGESLSNVSCTNVTNTTMKRNYSQADLDAAVNDIRCGRLGTRRASVVYGIPRSTLRNKIYKLEAAEELNGETSQYKRRRSGCQASAMNRTPTNLAKKKFCIKTAENGSLPEKMSSTTVDDSSVGVCVRNLPGTADSSEVVSVDVKPSKWDHSKDGNSVWTKNVWNSLIKNPISKDGNAGTTIDEKKSCGSPSNGTESPCEYKRSRPKRGQYRKYDKDALDEAVKSVRRGEMSVHKAGSFYGVPHSTLEYKVKERNLLRGKKRQKSLDDNSSECGGSDNGLTVRSSPSLTPISSVSPTSPDILSAPLNQPAAAVTS